MADNDTDQEVGIWIRVNTQGGKAFGDLARDLSRVSRAAVDTSRGFQSFIGVLKPFTFIWESVWRITYRALFILRALSNAVLMAAQAFVKFTKSITGIAWALGSGLVRAARASTERILGLAHAVGQKLVGGLARVYRWVTQLATVGFGALVAYTGRAVASFGQFEQALRNTSTVMGLVGRAVRQSEKALFDFGLYLSRKGIQSAQEVAQSFYDMGSAGLSLLQILQASPGILALAEATLSDLSQTAETTMGTMMGLRLSFSETNRVANAMAAAIALSPATMTKLTRALRYMGPVAGSFNIQLEEMLANMQALFFVGLPGEMVGTGLRMFILRLIAPTKESIKILQKYGLTVDDVNISVHGLTRVVERLAKAHLEASDLSMIFRARALTAASALLQQAGQLRRYQRELTNTNAAFQLQRLQLDTLAGTWKNLSNILAEVTLRFGRAASSGVRAALDIFRRVGLVAIRSHNVTNLGTAVGEIARQLGVLSGSAALKGLEGLSDFVTFVSTHGRAAIQLLAQMGRSFTGGLLSTAGSQMSSGLYDIGQALQSVVEAAGRLAGVFVRSGAIQSFLQLIASLIPRVTSIAENFLQVMLTRTPRYLKILEWLGDRGVQLLARFADILLDALSPENAWAFVRVLDVIGRGFLVVADTVVKMATALLQSGSVEGIMEMFVGWLPTLATVGIGLANAFAQALPTIIELGNALGTVLIAALIELANYLPILLNPRLVQQFMTFLQALGVMLIALIRGLLSLIPQLVSFIQQITPILIAGLFVVLMLLPRILGWLQGNLIPLLAQLLLMLQEGLDIVLQFVAALREVHITLKALFGDKYIFEMLKLWMIVALLQPVISLVTAVIHLVASFVTLLGVLKELGIVGKIVIGALVVLIGALATRYILRVLASMRQARKEAEELAPDSTTTTGSATPTAGAGLATGVSMGGAGIGFTAWPALLALFGSPRAEASANIPFERVGDLLQSGFMRALEVNDYPTYLELAQLIESGNADVALDEANIYITRQQSRMKAQPTHWSHGYTPKAIRRRMGIDASAPPHSFSLWTTPAKTGERPKPSSTWMVDVRSRGLVRIPSPSSRGAPLHQPAPVAPPTPTPAYRPPAVGGDADRLRSAEETAAEIEASKSPQPSTPPSLNTGIGGARTFYERDYAPDEETDWVPFKRINPFTNRKVYEIALSDEEVRRLAGLSPEQRKLYMELRQATIAELDRFMFARTKMSETSGATRKGWYNRALGAQRKLQELSMADRELPGYKTPILHQKPVVTKVGGIRGLKLPGDRANYRPPRRATNPYLRQVRDTLAAKAKAATEGAEEAAKDLEKTGKGPAGKGGGSLWKWIIGLLTPLVLLLAMNARKQAQEPFGDIPGPEDLGTDVWGTDWLKQFTQLTSQPGWFLSLDAQRALLSWLTQTGLSTLGSTELPGLGMPELTLPSTFPSRLPPIPDEGARFAAPEMLWVTTLARKRDQVIPPAVTHNLTLGSHTPPPPDSDMAQRVGADEYVLSGGRYTSARDINITIPVQGSSVNEQDVLNAVRHGLGYVHKRLKEGARANREVGLWQRAALQPPVRFVR